MEPNYDLVVDAYQTEDICRDGVDNDCDGDVDEVECSAFCGDGFADSVVGEECDDGNTVDGDGCDLDCLKECGNSRIDSNEECDDGNTITEECVYGEESCVVCDANCTEIGGNVVGYCGDNEVNGPEECDDGNTITEECGYGEESCTVCNANCTEIAGNVIRYCGDGIVNGPEQCDGESWCSNECTGTPPPCDSSQNGCPNIEWISIQGGSFSMGSNDGDSDEQPIHTVNVPSFEMMKTEVTVGMYRGCVNAGACTAPGCSNSSTSRGVIVCNYTQNRETHPVNYISWNQLTDFAEWVGARLPSESEWEFAARGGDRNVRYPWGNTDPDCSTADYYDSETSTDCNGPGTSPVCNTPNGNSLDGLCDMGGNLYEWVQDKYNSNYTEAPNDGSAWTTNMSSSSRVLRGGSWSNYAGALRVANRSNISLTVQVSICGGRLSRSLIP